MKIQASARLSAFVISEKEAMSLLKKAGIPVGKAVEHDGRSTTFQIEADAMKAYAALLTKKYGHPETRANGKTQQWAIGDSGDSIFMAPPSSFNKFPTIEVVGT